MEKKGRAILKMKKVRSVLVFANGNVAVGDPDGKQIAELQMNLLSDWAQRAHEAGYDVEGVVIEVQHVGNFRLRRGEFGWMAVPFSEVYRPGPDSGN